MEGTWGDVYLEEGLLRWLLNWRVKLAGRLGPCRPGLWDESVLTVGDLVLASSWH